MLAKPKTKRQVTRGAIVTGDPHVIQFLDKKVHTWVLLRAQNHCFPAGIVHLAHMVSCGPTFVVKITRMIHEGHQIMHFHAYMQPSILTSRVSSIQSSISLMVIVLDKLMYWQVGGVVKTTAV